MKIIVEVLGGVVTSVYSDVKFGDIQILDWDNHSQADDEERAYYEKLAEEAKTLTQVY